MMQILKFYQDNCGPCKVMSPIVEQVAAETGVQVTDVNVQVDFKKAGDYSVMSVPALVFLKDGKEVGRLTGIHSKEKILEVLNK